MQKKLNFDYIIIQITYFMTMAVMAGYGSYLLIERGFSLAATGLILSLASAFSILVQLICASIADNKKMKVLEITSLLCFLFSMLALINYFNEDSSKICAIVYLVLAGIYYAIEPLISSIPKQFADKGLEVKFGIGRAFGSISYALASVIIGYLAKIYGHKAILIITFILGVFMFINSYKTLKDFKEDDKTIIKDKINYFAFLKRHITFTLFCLAVIGIYFGFTLTDNMMAFVMLKVNGNSADIGKILAVKACLEIPVIFFYDKIEKRFDTITLLKTAVIGFSVKALIILLANNLFWIYVSQLAQPFSLALIIPAVVSFVNQTMDEKEAVRGQSLFTSAITFSCILSMLLGGYLCEAYSINTMLGVGFVVSLISTIFALKILKK